MATSCMTFFTREKEHLKILDLTDDNSCAERTLAPFPLPTPKAALWSPNGAALALVDPQVGVQVLTFSSGDEQEVVTQTLEGAPKTTQGFLWSPQSSALVTVAPSQKGSQEPNLHVWRKGAGEEEYTLHAAFHHPKLEKDKKVLEWTSDEAFCARLLPDGQIHILGGADLGGAALIEMELSGAAQTFEFARARGSFRARLAVFVPDTRDDLQRVVGPAEVSIWDFSTAASDPAGLEAKEKAKMQVASGQLADLRFNATSSALLAHCQTEVDETGQSYYGGSKLVFLASDGKFQRDLTESEGTTPQGTIVQAVEWSPTRDEFILIHGFQPSVAALYAWDERKRMVLLAKVLLEKAHRNTIRFNHFGSLVCLAGFGNLAGQVDFFGRADDADEEKCDFIRVSSCQANCTVSADWAPDGRHFLTSVLAPRMRVDNGSSIWDALAGVKVSERQAEELFDAQWRPEPPESLRYLDVSWEEIETASKALQEAGTCEGAKEKKQAYRPPKARGETGSTVAAMMRGEVAAPDMDRRKRQTRPQRTREEEDATHNNMRREDMPWNQPRERAETPVSPEQESKAAMSPLTGPARSPLLPPQSPPQQPPQQPPSQPPLPQMQLPPQQQQPPQQPPQRPPQQPPQQPPHQPPQQPPQQSPQQPPHQQQQPQPKAAQQARTQQQQQRQQQQQQQQPLSQRPPPPNEMPPPRDARTLREVEALQAQGLAANLAGYPNQQQQQQAQAQQAQQQRALQQQQAQQQQQQQQQQREQQQKQQQQKQQQQAQQQAQQQQIQQQIQQHLQQQLQQQQFQQAQQQQYQQAQQYQAAQAAASLNSAKAAQQQAQRAAAQAQQNQNQTRKLAPPASGWQYVDPKQNIQGPFTLLEMQQWNAMGYFRPDLPMRCDSSDIFVPFGELFPHPLVPFQSYPKRPPRQMR